MSPTCCLSLWHKSACNWFCAWATCHNNHWLAQKLQHFISLEVCCYGIVSLHQSEKSIWVDLDQWTCSTVPVSVRTWPWGSRRKVGYRAGRCPRWPSPGSPDGWRPCPSTPVCCPPPHSPGVCVPCCTPGCSPGCQCQCQWLIINWIKGIILKSINIF